MDDMRVVVGNILGVCAVLMFVLSYQMKSRRGLIFMNAGSRILYVAQYIVLGAVEGAFLDVSAFLVSLLCQNSDKGFIKKHFALTVVLANLFIVAVGLLSYKNIFSLLAILGVIFETLAFWLKNERNIRIVSFLGAPCWFAYNMVKQAYGTAAGNVITVVSIALAIVRYDILKNEKADN